MSLEPGMLTSSSTTSTAAPVSRRKSSDAVEASPATEMFRSFAGDPAEALPDDRVVVGNGEADHRPTPVESGTVSCTVVP